MAGGKEAAPFAKPVSAANVPRSTAYCCGHQDQVSQMSRQEIFNVSDGKKSCIGCGKLLKDYGLLLCKTCFFEEFAAHFGMPKQTMATNSDKPVSSKEQVSAQLVYQEAPQAACRVSVPPQPATCCMYCDQMLRMIAREAAESRFKQCPFCEGKKDEMPENEEGEETEEAGHEQAVQEQQKGEANITDLQLAKHFFHDSLELQKQLAAQREYISALEQALLAGSATEQTQEPLVEQYVASLKAEQESNRALRLQNEALKKALAAKK